MKRGRLRPNVATRWVMGRNVSRLYPPPMWVKVEFAALMAWPVDDPDYFPVPITGSDCSIGMYSYETGDGATVWRGEWENVYGDGDWHFGQSVDENHGVQTHFALYYGDASLGYVIYSASNPDDQDGIWNDAFIDRHGAKNWRMPAYPMVFLDFASVRAVTYDELKTLGYLDRPNKPWTFIYDP